MIALPQSEGIIAKPLRERAATTTVAKGHGDGPRFLARHHPYRAGHRLAGCFLEAHLVTVFQPRSAARRG